jgi:hypothetical protein
MVPMAERMEGRIGKANTYQINHIYYLAMYYLLFIYDLVNVLFFKKTETK